MVKRTERGWAGHFICSDRCIYHRNTLLECGDKRIVVSTVGNFRPREGKMDTVGHRRYYETMAWPAKLDRGYWEVDVQQEQIHFDAPWSICADSVEQLPDNVDSLADEQHESVVEELMAKLESEANHGA